MTITLGQGRKKPFNLALRHSDKVLLAKIAEQTERSQAAMIRVLIREEAARRGINSEGRGDDH